jgi:hypothetical protein
MTTYTFQRVTLNGIKGWLAVRRVRGIYAGQLFGKTKHDAIAAFEVDYA